MSHEKDVPRKVTWGQAMLLGLPGGEVPTYSVGDETSQKASKQAAATKNENQAPEPASWLAAG